MKAITIHQPWASLIAHGIKQYETRSWSVAYRGPIAIHAGRSRDGLNWLARGNGHQASAVRNIVAETGLWQTVQTVGSIIAVGKLTHIYRSEDMRDHLSDQELILGDYAEGRFGWEITEIELLPEPLVATGKQGLWDWHGQSREDRVRQVMQKPGFQMGDVFAALVGVPHED